MLSSGWTRRRWRATGDGFPNARLAEQVRNEASTAPSVLPTLSAPAKGARGERVGGQWVAVPDTGPLAR